MNVKNVFKMTVMGITGTLGWFLWRRWHIPMREHTMDVAVTRSSPHVISLEHWQGERPLQIMARGTGPLYHRRYRADILKPQQSAEELMGKIQQNIQDFIAIELAHFEKITGEPNILTIGDEYYVHITGPWDGPVRTIDVAPTSFSFATLTGHLEAGEILFSIFPHPEEENALRFEIVSWARSRDWRVAFAYDIAKIARIAQTSLWVYFCKRVVEESGGELMGKIDVLTQKVTQTTQIEQTPQPLWKQYQSQIEAYRGKKINFDLDQRHAYTKESGWNIDEYQANLPAERPGEPIKGGSWEMAKQVLLNYEFPDPSLITGVFLPDEPLKDRVMVLRARWLIFSFMFGTRIGTVIEDELRQDEKLGPARVWGYSYRTLEGHFEMGEITFEIWKFLETGNVVFRMHAYSKTDRIPNLAYRIGFRMFGRKLQKRFATTAQTRMQQLVIERLAKQAGAQDIPQVETPEVQPANVDAKAAEKLNDAQDTIAGQQAASTS